MQNVDPAKAQIDTEALALEQAKALQEQINYYLKQLSLERLQTILDFVAFLDDKESEEATQELLEIPGLLEEVQQQSSLSPEAYVNWRDLKRSDV